MKLLTRTEFTQLTLASTNLRCAVGFCSAGAVDAHHIFNRNLWNDGGYYLENGAPLCARHHLEAELTILSPAKLFEWLERTPVRPPGLQWDHEYDTWGNEMVDEFTRLPGPLFSDSGCQRALDRGQVLWMFQA